MATPSSPPPSRASAPLRAWLTLTVALGLAASSVAAALPAHDHARHDHPAGPGAPTSTAATTPSTGGSGATASVTTTTAPGSDGAGATPAYDRAEVPLVDVGVPGTIDRAPVPRDRHELARGCYTLATAGGAVGRADGGGLAVGVDAAEPLRVQSTTLGRVLLRASDDTFVAAPAGTGTSTADTVTGSTPGGMAGGLTIGASDDAAAAAGTTVDDAEATVAARDEVVLATAPSPRADWEVSEVPGGFRLALADGRVLAVGDDDRLRLTGDPDGVAPARTRFGFRLADGCSALPDPEIGIDGPHVGGATPYQETRGYLDAHVHMMAFEFLGGAARCGRPWHPYGAEHALVDCPDHEPGGRGALLEVAVSGGDPVAGHDTVGWPTFVDWPAYGSLTHEQMYYRWLERSWRGGLRLMVNLLVDNNQLCKLWAYRDHGCNEMDGVRLQAQRLRELEAYVDAQSGGPGEGWLRIVTDPFEAREVINSGRLAVVMGIEVSVLFDCRVYLGVPRCDTEDIDRQLAEVHDLGVRQMELVNKFDNALSGVTGDSGTTGVVVNGGNFLDTGSFWRMRTCDTDDHGHDRTQPNPHDEGLPDDLTGRDALAGAILQTVGASGRAPVYPEGPHCNERGLTLHGRYLLERMAERGMIFDPDHMSARARHEALDVMAELGHSGLVSSHGWADETIYPRIYELGGVVTPYPRRADRFVDEWRAHRAWANPRYLFGIGYGADTNGFGAQAPPRPGADETPLTYPFTGLGGTTVARQVSGERTYDLNVDGVAHYGLYPDFVADATLVAGDDASAFTEDLVRGPEAYLQMWERALGITRSACDDAGLAPAVADLEALPRGATTTEVLHAVGQPASRVADTFRYCARGDGAIVRVEVTFDADGRVVDVGRA